MATNLFVYATSLAIFSLLTQTHCIIVQFDANNIVDQTCQQTPNYDECKKFLDSDPRSSTADVRGLALILVDILKGETTKSVQLVKQIQGKYPGLVKPLSECEGIYNVILTADIPVANQALEQDNPKFAEEGMNDAANDATSCERGFKGGKSPLSGSNELLNDISRIASAVIRLLL